MSTIETLRKRYLELHAAGKPADDALLAGLAATDLPATTTSRGLSLCAWPSARFVQLRFVPLAELDAAARDHFARPCRDLPELAAAFVDPHEASYHCFENLLSLDRLFEDLPHEPITLKPNRASRHVQRMRTRMAARLRERLALLDTLDLYTRPRGEGRGGRRFLFSAAPLADALANALRRTMSKAELSNFVGVNPVFRCNRFEAGDARFEEHFDVPFSWSARKLVSKQTLLLYLSGGRGRDVLRFGDELRVDAIEEGELFVFGQRIAHEGGPYDEGPKIFVRSELIFHDPALVDSPDVAALFAKACYLDGLQPFTPELARFANAHYERATRARFAGRVSAQTREPYLHCEFAGVHFVTNGYEGWFRASEVEPIEAATLMLLELLNPSIGGHGKSAALPFRALRRAEVHHRSGDPREWITELLSTQPAPRERPFDALDHDTLFPPPESVLDGLYMPRSLDFESYDDDWDSHRHAKVVDRLRRAQRWALRRIRSAPITLLGKQVFVAPERFVVRGDEIHLLGPESLGPMHFAGAVFLDPSDYLEPTVTIEAWQTIVPPITFRREGELLQLGCDLFRNSWMVDARLESVPIPQVTDDEVVGDQAYWHRAAARASSKDALQAELSEPLESDAKREGQG